MVKAFSSAIKPQVEAVIENMISDIKKEENMRKIINILVLSSNILDADIQNETDDIVDKLAGEADLKSNINDYVEDKQQKFVESQSGDSAIGKAAL